MLNLFKLILLLLAACIVLPIILLFWLVGIPVKVTTKHTGRFGATIKRVRKYRWIWKISDVEYVDA